jgi:biopolymer transport protein TolR
MSMSNRAKRMLQHQVRNKADAELNLIPMIDILSVMVSFLLVYAAEVEVVQNSKGIDIPQSISEQRPRQTVVVMLTKDDLFVQGERVASVNEVRASTTTIIAPLRAALKRPTLVGSVLTDKDIAAREITVMADKLIPYEVLKKVMSTCTDADYGRISFALMQKEKAVNVNQLRRQMKRAEGS